MIKFQYNDKGVLEVWKDGVKIGEMITMGDEVNKETDTQDKKEKKGKKGHG